MHNFPRRFCFYDLGTFLTKSDLCATNLPLRFRLEWRIVPKTGTRRCIVSADLGIILDLFIFLFFNLFLIEFIGVTWLIKLYRVKGYNSIIHYLYVVFCAVHHPKSYLLPSPFIPPLPSPASPTPISLW